MPFDRNNERLKQLAVTNLIKDLSPRFVRFYGAELQGKLSCFQLFLNVSQKAFSISAIDYTVVEAQREICQPTNGAVVFALRSG